MASFTKSDLYGTGPAGMNPGALAPVVNQASGAPGASVRNLPAMIWVGFVVMLVAMRVLWEKAG